MDPPAHECSLESEDYSPSDAEKEASDQLERELQSNETYKDAPSLERQMNVTLTISPSYVEDWNSTDAFREFYQNWRDAILERFGLDRLEFQPYYEDKGDCVSIVVPDPTDQRQRRRAVGYIKYEKKTGRVILANPCAQLQPEALQLGYTSKQGNDSLAGCYGEGLKLAALVMSRNGYKVKVATSNCNWRFSLQGPCGSRFCCVICPSKQTNTNSQTDAADDMARLRSRIDRDVAVVIGARRHRKDQPVSLAVFREWMGMTLDVRGPSYPSHIIETDDGDLVLDPRFHGKVYVKGMILSAPASKSRVFKFGYNFANGLFGRDRQRFDRREESDVVRRIWESAIRKHETVLLPIYVNLLRNFPQAADVESADRLLGDSTRSLIWKHLLRETEGKLFYYSDRCNAKVVEYRLLEQALN